jgi:hypothetical protein
MIGGKRSGLNRPRVTVKVVRSYQSERAIRGTNALPELLYPGDGPSVAGMACVFRDTGHCRNDDFTLTFCSGCKQVAYEVWTAVRRKKPAPRAEAGRVCFYLCTVVVGEANLDNLSALVIPEL